MFTVTSDFYMIHPVVKSFQEKVYAVTKLIPKGKVATYGQIATLVGSPSAARAVGMCLSRNKDPKIVPCHRVVAADGRLTGYAFGNGISSKKTLLSKEGVIMIGERVNLATSQWRP